MNFQAMRLPRISFNLFGRKKALNEAPAKKGGKRIYHRLKKARQYQVDLEMDALGKAVDAAKDSENPNHEDLYSIYGQIKKDRHLKSQVETAINDIQQSPFIVEVDGKEDEALRELFDAEWFDDFIEYTADAEFWGHSLIEFPEVNETQTYSECFLLPRENVDPARQRIVLDRDSMLFLPYDGNQESLNLVEVFGKEELGVFEYAAEEVILKKYARTDWSQASERYGMPFLDIETETEDKKELDAIEDSAAGFASNGYFIHGTDTKVTIQQAANGDFYKIYMEAIELSNKELSKLVNGQTGTGDNQAWAGTAEVHERVKNAFTRARLRRVQNHVNGKLIPLMVKMGYREAAKLARAKLRYTDLLDDDPKLATEPGEDPNNPDLPGEGNTGAKAKLLARKKKSPVIRGSGTEVIDEYLKEIRQGTGIDIAKTEYSNPRFKLYSNLQNDAARFATFREHNKQRELAGAVTDRDRAKIEKKYKNYLETEKLAIFSNSAAAERWMGFEENADLYPNLEWRTVGDAQVRPEHAALHGLVLPINDPFWNSHTPPLGFGCRCELIQTDKKAKPNEGYKTTPTPKGFEFNPGVEQKLFSDNAGYYKNVPKNTAEKLTKEALKIAGMRSKKEVLTSFPASGQTMKLTQAKDLDEIKISKTDIRNITYKFHENKTLRNNLLYDLPNVMANAKLVHTALEGKGRTAYLTWYYLQVSGFDNMFLNVVKMKSGELKLHAITNRYEKK